MSDDDDDDDDDDDEKIDAADPWPDWAIVECGGVTHSDASESVYRCNVACERCGHPPCPCCRDWCDACFAGDEFGELVHPVQGGAPSPECSTRGYPQSAECIRARADALQNAQAPLPTQPQAPPPPAWADPPMTDELADAYDVAMQPGDQTPEFVREMADYFEAEGYPDAARKLRARADELEANPGS
jgi:hypothetical protein